MTNLLKSFKSITIGLCLSLVSFQVLAESSAKDDGQIKEEVAKFCDENSKMREEHIQSMRELHLKHVNELYDRKLAHSKEMGELWKQIKPGDKSANKKLKEQIEDKQDAYKKEEEKFRKDFKENILHAKNKSFREGMKDRHKGMKKKFKD